MPIYSYKCKDCGEQFDLLVGMTAEKAQLKCSKCNSKNIEKVISTFSVGGQRGSSSTGSSCSTGSCPTCY
jgi:putative FmdB family regulatory protein